MPLTQSSRALSAALSLAFSLAALPNLTPADEIVTDSLTTRTSAPIAAPLPATSSVADAEVSGSTASLSPSTSLTQAPIDSASTPSDIRPSTTGLYPIWENTGFVERHREIYLGTNGAHYGIADRAHIGTQPMHFLYRAPNFYAKVSLLRQGGWSLSAQAGAFYLMNEASRAFLSPMYSSRLDNPDFNVILLPMSFATTYELSDWLQIHQTATALGIYSSSGQLNNEVFPGYTAVAELLARRRHSVLLHFGEVGFWKHDFTMTGVSYRYHNSWLDLQAGYFYRFRADGSQSAPMVSLGFLL